MPEHYKDIKGWFDYSNLYNEAVEEGKNGDIFVEVGSFQGRSAIYLAELIKESGKDIRLVCVDLWPAAHNLEMLFGKGAGQGSEAGLIRGLNKPLVEVFQDNVYKAGVQDIVFPVRQDSSLAACLFPDYSLKFCFIDAAHEHALVLKDLRAWFPKVKEGGVFAGHDFEAGRGVQRALDDYFTPLGIPYEVVPPNSWKVKK